MKRGTVTILAEYKARRAASARTYSLGATRLLPDPDRLWELLDRNISLDVWQKRS